MSCPKHAKNILSCPCGYQRPKRTYMLISEPKADECPFPHRFLKEMIVNYNLCPSSCPEGCLIKPDGKCEHIMDGSTDIIIDLDEGGVVDITKLSPRLVSFKSWALILKWDVKKPWQSSARDVKSIPAIDARESMINRSKVEELDDNGEVISRNAKSSSPIAAIDNAKSRHEKGKVYRDKVFEKYNIKLQPAISIHVNPVNGEVLSRIED